MITYDPLWETMKHRQITTYALITRFGISSRTINNLKHNKSITMFTLDKLCTILECTPSDIIRYTK
ncbi:MAG: helix-turn-helix transcriptional regulator [Hespellia sp.]|nr:helix-turn-helix transcriptional regulator [Hespellia sp.]